MGEQARERRSLQDLVRGALQVADDDERSQLLDLDRRWEDRRLQVIVAGEAKRGKSTLINALIGQEVLPTGLTPLTSVATTVTSGSLDGGEGVTVRFLDGRSTDVDKSTLERYVTETGNPSNRLSVRDVTVRVSTPLLDHHAVDLIDTPGIGSVFAHNTAEATKSLARLDAAILVLSADPPITAAERELLRAITASSVQTFVVINKSDRFTPEELSQSLAFTQRVCAEATGRDVVPQACSALRAQHDPGFARFTDDLSGYLATRGDSDLTEALYRHTARTLHAMLDTRRVHRRALELAEQGDTAAAEALRQRLAAISGHRSEIRDRLTGSLQRLRQQLDAAAAAAIPRLSRACQTAFEQAWAGELANAPLQGLEARARAVVAEHLSAAVDAWRQAQASRLEHELDTVIQRASADTAAQVALARQAVADALDVAVGAHDVAAELSVDLRFSYDFSPGQGWDPPLRGAIAALRTPASRRRRVKELVGSSIGAMTDRQVGRARADLQRRLEDSRRALVSAMERRLSETVDQLVHVLDRVAVADQGRADRAAQQRDLARQESALVDLIRAAQERMMMASGGGGHGATGARSAETGSTPTARDAEAPG